MKRVADIVVVVFAALVFAGPVWAQGNSAGAPEKQSLREGAQQAAEAVVADRVDSQLPASASGSSQEEEEDPSGIRVFWSDGLRMETNDGRFQIRVGGRIQPAD